MANVASIPTLAADLIALILGADAATLPQERRAEVEAKLREAMGVTYAGACEMPPMLTTGALTILTGGDFRGGNWSTREAYTDIGRQIEAGGSGGPYE